MPIKVWSYRLPRLTAAIAPAGMPIRIANNIAQTDNSMVAGNSATNSLSTASLVDSETPKLPCSNCQT